MTKPLSAMISLPDMRCDIVERVAINRCEIVFVHGLGVTLAFNKRKEEPLFLISRRSRVTSLESTRMLNAWPLLIHCLKHEQPDVLLSNLDYNNIVAIWTKCLAGVKAAVITGEHNVSSSEPSSSPSWQHRILPLLYRMFSRFADGVLAVSKGVADDMTAQCEISRESASVIYSPIAIDRRGYRHSCTHCWRAGKDASLFARVGNRVPQNIFRLLICAFPVLSNRHRARLAITGNGPLWRNLCELECRLGAGGAVDLIDYRKNPHPRLKQAAADVLPSRIEGLGNALVDAISRYTPILSMDYPFGPSRILANADYRLLMSMDDSESMAGAMAITLIGRRRRDLLMRRASEFSAEAISRKYLSYSKLQ